MRLDRYLALYGAATRGDARGWLRAGRVFVNGDAARDAGMIIDEQTADVALDGDRIPYRAAMHLMLNKPAGVLTAASDPRRETVMDLLPPVARSLLCMPVGRLDLDTEGLLLFTTDGQLAHRLLAPKRGVDKLYEAHVDGQLSEADTEAFAAGIRLSDFVAEPAALEILPGGARARVTVHEGKFHQIKRMFLARGRTVTRLKRLSFGGVWLDEALPPGGFRELTDTEAGILYQASGGRTDG